MDENTTNGTSPDVVVGTVTVPVTASIAIPIEPLVVPEPKAVDPVANRAAVAQARSLIAAGKVNRDSGWEISADDENALLGDPPDWEKYGLWHLGKRPGVNAETKGAYAYPYGKGGKVYRGAIIAIKSRSAQQGHDAINATATALLKMIDKGKDIGLDESGRLVLSVAEWEALAYPVDVQLRETFWRAVVRGHDEVVGHEQGGVLRFKVSTEDVDRSRDIVKVAGWRTTNWEANPVVMFAHDYHSLPVAKGLAVEKQTSLLADAEFPSKALYPFGNTVYAMLREGYLNAVSVGFAPIKYNRNEDRGGLDFEEQELLEFSVVPVPANPNALVVARDAGIDVEPVIRWAQHIAFGEQALPDMKVLEGRIVEAIGKLIADVAVLKVDIGARLDSIEEAVLGGDEEVTLEVDDEPEAAETELDAKGTRAMVKDIVQRELTSITGKLPDGPAADKGRTQ
jgi:HK97 family phage prohead protease